MRTIVVLMDTLKRNMIEVYNKNTWVKTPNISSFAKESVTFDNHWIGSAPCMPARRDILTGRLNFLERSWGPIEPFDITLPNILKKNNVFSHITTDHCHYFRLGGEDYCQQFDTWDYHRGQEGDPWISRLDDPSMPTEYYGRVRRQYQWNRTKFTSEDEYPSPKTFKSACNWLEDNKNHDNFFLMVEAFDPHEPFDVPDEYLKLYGCDSEKEPYFEIPNYSEVDVPKEALDYLNKRYAALLTMTDNYFGKLINKLKELNIYEDTMVIMTTDHGYFLGERNYLGKNFMHSFNELAHIPLIVHLPKEERKGERVNNLTQNIDIMPTILDYNEIPIPEEVQGMSWKKIFNGESYDKDYVLYGYHGIAVNITDGDHTYFRAPNKENSPCFEYTCIPTTIRSYLGVGVEEDIETGRFLKRTKYPVYKIPIKEPSILCDRNKPREYIEESKLFNIENDYDQVNNILDEKLEEKYIELLKRGLREYDAPEEQLDRLCIR